MRFSQRWWVIVVLLFAFAVTVSAPTAQTEEPSPVNAPSSAEVQSSSDEPGQKQPTLTPNRDMTAADVEIDRRVNELWRELLNNRKKTIDDRAKTIDWWLEATAIFLTLLGVAAAILGYFGFKRLDRIESEARKNMETSEKHAQEAQRYKEEAQRDLEKIRDEAQRDLEKIRDEARRYLEETKASRDESQAIMEKQRADLADNAPYKIDEDEKNGQQKSDSLNQAVAAAISLQQQSKIEEAIEKWRSIANIAEGTDNELAARAWFSVGYLTSPKNTFGEDFKEAVKAYDKAIEIDPSYPVAYFNRGNAKASLGWTKAAVDDYDAAIGLDYSYAVAYFNRGNVKIQLDRIDEARKDFETVLNLAREAGNAELTTHSEHRLKSLG